MDFYKKYELLELLRGDRVRVFSGREIATGRAVQVHLFTSGKTPETTALLERALRTPPGYRGVLLDIGEHEGTPYVVTVLPAGFETLEAWLDRVVPAVRREAPGQSKIWKIPVIPAPPHPPPPPAPTAARPLAPSDDAFAQLFGALEPARPAAQPAEGPTRTLQAPPPPPPPRAAAPQPDPFALLFDSSPAAPAPQAPAAGGDFRHLIITPDRPTQGAPPPPPAPVAPPPPSAGAGEFTRMFQAPGAAQPAPPKPQQAGEFTRMFQAPSGAPAAPAAPTPASAPPPTAAAGEFTRFFKSPLEPKPLKESGFGSGSSADPFAGRPMPPPSSKPLDAPGEFTRMFGKDDIPGRKTPLAPPGPPMPPPSSMGSVTQAFAAAPPPQPGPMPGVPPPDMQASGPSEYTRLFKAPVAPPEAAPLAPQAAAAPAPPKASKLPLILVIVGLVAVIVILVLFLVLRK